MKTKLLGFVTLLLIATVSAQLESAQTTICNILEDVYDLLLYVATGVAALMIVLQGILWISSGANAKSRGAATGAVVHAIIGLIVVSLAVTIVTLVLNTGCITTW